jgi:hypothetical protein
VNVTFPPDDIDAEKAETDITMHLPPPVIDHFYTKMLNSTKMAERTCDVMKNYCPDVYAFNGFTSSNRQGRQDCIHQMDALPLAEPNDSGINTIDSNTTGCRHLHANLATLDPELHCPHLSIKPLADIRGNTKCSVSAHYNNSELFTDDDFFLFERVARDSNVDPSTLLQPNVPLDELRTCDGDQSDYSYVLNDVDLPSTFVCKNYLAFQLASGDFNALYWTILWGFIIGYRALSIFFLRYRNTSQI